jgi:hypothetical protein
MANGAADFMHFPGRNNLPVSQQAGRKQVINILLPGFLI